MCVPCAPVPADRLAALAPHQPSWLRRKSPDSSLYSCNHSYQAGSPRAALLICSFIHEERRPQRVALIFAASAYCAGFFFGVGRPAAGFFAGAAGADFWSSAPSVMVIRNGFGV